MSDRVHRQMPEEEGSRLRAWLRKKSLIGFALLAMAAPSIVHAQAVQPVAVNGGVVIARFFVALIAGLILAIAFQLILTDLSVAAGLNFLGGTRALRHPASRPSPQEKESRAAAAPPAGETARKISGAFGVWALVTATIALFFASWLAVELSLTTNGAVGWILGLSIWGLFFILMVILESSAVISLVGSLGKLMASGVRSAMEATGTLFSKVSESGTSENMTKATSSIRDQIFGGSDVKDALQSAVDKAKGKEFSVDDFRQHMEHELTPEEWSVLTSQDVPSAQTIQSWMPAGGQWSPDKSLSIAQGVQQTLEQLKKEAPGQAGAASQDPAFYRDKLGQYIRSSQKQELMTFDTFRREIDKIFDPKAAPNVLKSRIAQIDRNAITALLGVRRDLSSDETRKLTDVADQKIQEYKKASAGQPQAKDSLNNKIRLYLASLNQIDLDFGNLKLQIINFLKDPKATMETISDRLQSLDREDLKAMLSSRGNISQEDLDRILGNFDSMKDNLTQKAEQARAQIQARIEQAKTEALHQADEVRKTAATAAWWVFGTAVVSGVAAIIGGSLGVR